MQCSGADSHFTNASHRLSAETSRQSIPRWIACLSTVAGKLSVSIAGQAPSRSPDRTVRQASPRLQHGPCRRTIIKSIDRASRHRSHACFGRSRQPRCTSCPTQIQRAERQSRGAELLGRCGTLLSSAPACRHAAVSVSRSYRKSFGIIWIHNLVTIHSALLSVTGGPVATE